MLVQTKRWRWSAAALAAVGVWGPVWAQTPGESGPPPSPAPVPDPAPSEPPSDPAPRRGRFRIGPQVGFFLPTAGKTRNRFGDSWFSFGVGFGPVEQAKSQGRFGVDLNFYSETSGDNRAFFAPLGLSYRRALSQGNLTPYVGASVNVVFADLRSREDNVTSGFRAGGGGSVFLGATFNDNGFFEARYLAVSKIRGFDLSGLDLTAGIRF